MSLPLLIGVIHLPPLPGAPGAADLGPVKAMQEALTRVRKEAQALTDAGFEGLIIENFGDAPFYKTRVPPETVAAMAILAREVRENSDLPLGINVLRNDADSAIAIAGVSGADFVRINVLSGVVATDQGLIEGEAARIVREKLRLGGKVRILADVHVKHARTLSSTDLAIAIEEVAGRGGADGVIVTGSTTGRSPDLSVISGALEAADHSGVPLYVGSGMTPESLSSLPSRKIGVIVGSALRRGGLAGAPLETRRLQAFVRAFRARLR